MYYKTLEVLPKAQCLMKPHKIKVHTYLPPTPTSPLPSHTHHLTHFISQKAQNATEVPKKNLRHTTTTRTLNYYYYQVITTPIIQLIANLRTVGRYHILLLKSDDLILSIDITPSCSIPPRERRLAVSPGRTRMDKTTSPRPIIAVASNEQNQTGPYSNTTQGLKFHKRRIFNLDTRKHPVAEIDGLQIEVERETALVQHALSELRYRLDELKAKLDRCRARDAERDERTCEYELAVPLDEILFHATRAALSALEMRDCEYHLLIFAPLMAFKFNYPILNNLPLLSNHRVIIFETLQDLDDAQMQLVLDRDDAGLEPVELELKVEVV
ncbi:hypothetical protein C8J57DRAFT_1217600 [Mycena rebaudengoi]|nr:hypothetical protein C8J57DRAFT_1217600 [Mycena rebaudengoi]